MCEDLISGRVQLPELVEKNPALLMNYQRMKINLAAYNLDKAQNSNPFKTSENLWIYGNPGSGKTYYATHLYKNYFLKNQTQWWDGYRGEEVIILDDYDKPIMGHYVKIWADNYNSVGEIKNGSIALNFKVFIVTSNYMPRTLWPNDLPMQYAICRRFRFISVTGNYPDFKPIKLPNPIESEF